MVVYTVYIIHGARCRDCKKWIKEITSKTQNFTESVDCICGKTYTPKELIGDLNARVSIKEFNSDRLYKEIMDQYISKNSTKQHANDMAQMVVSREQYSFEKKYGFGTFEQKRLF